MVTYDPVPGRIYDITCIVSALCDFEGYASFYKSKADEEGLKGTTLKIYEFIRTYDIRLDDDVSFLFRYNFNNERRFIGDYLRKCGAFTIFDSVNSFIIWIRNLSPGLLLPAFCKYLEQYAGGNLGDLRLSANSTPGEIYFYVSALELEPRWKLAVLSIFLDTPSFVSRLADVLVRCEAILKDINVQFLDYVRTVENRNYNANDIQKIWRNGLPSYDLVKLDDAIYSFSFLNDSMVLYMDSYKPVRFIFGCNAEMYKERDIVSEQINIEAVGKAVGDANRLQILKLLEDGPMYATQLAAKLQIAHTSLFYHVNLLYDAGLICVSVQGRKTYYSINGKQIGRMSRYLSEYCKKFNKEETTCGRNQLL